MNRGVPNTDKLLPGDRVLVIGGPFVGLQGTVLSDLEAKKLTDKIRGEQVPMMRCPPRAAHVALPLFGGVVPIILMRYQIELIGR